MKKLYNSGDLVKMLASEGEERKSLFARASKVKQKTIGNVVHFRGLIEFSNICGKDCLYCGIRHSNSKVDRYNLTDEEILTAARFALDNNYGSVVLQSGELQSAMFTARVENLVKLIKELSDGRLGITLSVGEQTSETYQRWYEAGAHRYLLRIETSNPLLYKQLHPADHSFDHRLQCLRVLKQIGYQTGTGVMIGLPGQTIEDLAADLLFFQEMDIDMVGMGPYIGHSGTPLYEQENRLQTLSQRFDLSLKMVACLRLLMPDINIAAATALQAIDKIGREKAIMAGANIIMPNITPGVYRDYYKLYDNKPCTNENAEDCAGCLEARIAITNHTIGYGEWGDSKHFKPKS